MNEVLSLILPFVAGVLLGAFFFGGLWWTVQKGISSEHPALWFLGSVLLRTSVVLAGFLFVSGCHWERLLMSLVGFVIARSIVTRLAPSPGKNQSRPAEEVSHAP